MRMWCSCMPASDGRRRMDELKRGQSKEMLSYLDLRVSVVDEDLLYFFCSLLINGDGDVTIRSLYLHQTLPRSEQASSSARRVATLNAADLEPHVSSLSGS
jgi:hypothetical protein